MNPKKRAPRQFLFVLVIVLALLPFGCQSRPTLLTKNGEPFRFVFATDVHLEPDPLSIERFDQAIAAINGLKPKPQFVIMGGDLIENSYTLDLESADRMYRLYQDACLKFGMPVHHIVGNNEIIGWSKASRVASSRPEYGKGMFRQRLGQGATYGFFDHGQWHFILLDSIERNEDPGLRSDTKGMIDEDQLKWLSEDLEKTGKTRPVCIALHIPLSSIFYQTHLDTLAAPAQFMMVNNGTAVIRLLAKYNVKIVLQGHVHIVEELRYKNTTYITGGSLSNARKDPNFEHPDGFVVVDVKGDEFRWKYVAYPWTSKE